MDAPRKGDEGLKIRLLGETEVIPEKVVISGITSSMRKMSGFVTSEFECQYKLMLCNVNYWYVLLVCVSRSPRLDMVRTKT